MTDTTTTFRNAIEAHLARERTSGRRLGLEALGDPGFVAAVERGRSPRLDTADRVLAHLGLAPMGPDFRREVEAFLAVTRTKRSIFGLEAAGAPSFVARLRGGASPRLATVDRVRAWMAAHASEAERLAIARRVDGAGHRAAAAREAVAPRLTSSSTNERERLR